MSTPRVRTLRRPCQQRSTGGGARQGGRARPPRQCRRRPRLQPVRTNHVTVGHIEPGLRARTTITAGRSTDIRIESLLLECSFKVTPCGVYLWLESQAEIIKVSYCIMMDSAIAPDRDRHAERIDSSSVLGLTPAASNNLKQP